MVQNTQMRPPAVETLDISIRGMSCAACVGRVEKAIRAVAGVAEANVNLATERATVTMADRAAAVEVDAAIRDAGYEPVQSRIEFNIDGMSCAACVGRVERAVETVPGVLDANANLATNRVTVTVLDNAEISSRIIAALTEAGYPATATNLGSDRADVEQARRGAEIADLRRRVIIAAAATLPLLVLEMGTHMSEELHHLLAGKLGEPLMKVLAFVLASIVLFGPGLGFYKKGFPALWRGAPDMNSLVAIGTMAAYGFSFVSTFLPRLLPGGIDDTYFESGAVVVTLILLGRYFEARAKGRTGDAIRKLMRLEAKSARILRNGEIVEVKIEDVRIGDLVQVRPGDRVPVDGEITEGSSFVDESMITGEPVPAQKVVGAHVIGGTINKSGSFTFRATRVGSDTLLAQIVRTVEAAQGAKLPIQAVVDRVTLWFVPVVMGLAALTFLAWLAFGPSPALSHALIHAVTVLIIACPCAMGLATPTSIMVGTGKAAEMGVLFRRGEALETLRNVQVIALDKTGTLTRGRPEMTDFVVEPGFGEADVLALVAAVEGRSEHPVAHAIVEAARRRGLTQADVTDFAAEAGVGVSASIGGRRVAVGSDRMLRTMGLDVGAFANAIARLADDGKTPLYAAVDGKLAALIAVADPIKETTPSAIAALKGLNKQVVMITGDNQRTAAAIARRLGIDRVVAEVLPTDKAAHVAKLQQDAQGSVAFVGDGINDAPALAQADVGLAVGNGTDIAIESADAVLMSGNLRNVANAIALSQATVTNIRQNLFWAFAYNVVLIPVAAGILYPFYGISMSPMLAGLAMAISSVSVVTNALRLRGFSPPFPAHDESPAMVEANPLVAVVK